MRAKQLWRVAPRFQKKTEPKRAMAVPPESMPPELHRKMVAAFERARAEQFAAKVPAEGRRAGDPLTRANTAAFLILERERRAMASRLCRPYRYHGDRYRDLILVTKLIRLEYEHLAGRVGPKAGPQSPPHGPADGETPADWARPWGSGPMVEIGTALTFYADQRDRLATRLPAHTVANAAADAARERNRILSRFERVKGEWRLEFEPGRDAAVDSEQGQAARATAEAAGHGKRAWPWASFGLPRPNVAVAAAFLVVGVGTLFAVTRGGGSPNVVNTASPVVASVPEPRAALAERARGSQPGRDRGARQRRHRGGGHKADQAALTASALPPPAPEPASEAAPAPVAPAAPPAPTPTPAPAPAPDDGPASKPQPDPNPGPGPVSSLPPPVNPLPGPSGS